MENSDRRVTEGGKLGSDSWRVERKKDSSAMFPQWNDMLGAGDENRDPDEARSEVRDRALRFRVDFLFYFYFIYYFVVSKEGRV